MSCAAGQYSVIAGSSEILDLIPYIAVNCCRDFGPDPVQCTGFKFTGSGPKSDPVQCTGCKCNYTALRACKMCIRTIHLTYFKQDNYFRSGDRFCFLCISHDIHGRCYACASREGQKRRQKPSQRQAFKKLNYRIVVGRFFLTGPVDLNESVMGIY